jgi:hypothetical protein
MNIVKSKFKIFWVVTLLGSLSSCSLRQIALDYHEFFATRTAIRFFDLNSEQKNIFTQRWTMFSRKVADSKVDHVARQIRSLGTAEDPLPAVETLQSIATEIMVESCSHFSPLLASLKREQVDYFRAKLEERNDKFDPEKQGGLSKFRKVSHEKSVEGVETWLGRISRIQEDSLRKLDDEKEKLSPGSWDSQYLLYSREAQRAFVSIIAENHGDALKIEQECISFVRRPERFLSPASKKFKLDLSKFRELSIRQFAASLEEDQRQFLIEETRKLAGELLDWKKNIKD